MWNSTNSCSELNRLNKSPNLSMILLEHVIETSFVFSVFFSLCTSSDTNIITMTRNYVAGMHSTLRKSQWFRPHSVFSHCRSIVHGYLHVPRIRLNRNPPSLEIRARCRFISTALLAIRFKSTTFSHSIKARSKHIVVLQRSSGVRAIGVPSTIRLRKFTHL